ncbi:hypothetical protein EV356DRAFT_128974 [Viridothelium virens]|uniref:Uncharacterized protein n=1 Tax=Viridothelium virens TaxID=1048519 RepID=A0A6A6HCB6_VIRVR|nr:hypothetical protein EV356DRAFT_128974 [Viridothelium virens]
MHSLLGRCLTEPQKAVCDCLSAVTVKGLLQQRAGCRTLTRLRDKTISSACSATRFWTRLPIFLLLPPFLSGFGRWASAGLTASRNPPPPGCSWQKKPEQVIVQGEPSTIHNCHLPRPFISPVYFYLCFSLTASSPCLAPFLHPALDIVLIPIFLNHRLRALDVARNSEGSLDPAISAYLERELANTWGRILQQPQSYLMTKDELSLFNYYRARFERNPRDSAISRAAIERFWRHYHAANGH